MVHFSPMPDKIRLQTVGELLKESAKRLRPKKIICEADQKLGWLEAEILMAHTVKKDRSWIIPHSNDQLAPSLKKRFLDYVDRRTKHEPVAYITGTKDFYGRPFFVNRSTLIPRPDTETMIDVLKKHYASDCPFVAWDVGTGSGAIAITVALEFPNAIVVASDICKRALRTAMKNAKLHTVEHRITFVHGSLLTDDVMKALTRSRRASQKKSNAVINDRDLIILANLPYLPEKDRKKLAKDVTAFEPAKALYSGKDGLDLIRRLFTDISERLPTNPNLILTEFDPPQAQEIKKTATMLFPLAKISIQRDLAKRDRILEVRM